MMQDKDDDGCSSRCNSTATGSTDEQDAQISRSSKNRAECDSSDRKHKPCCDSHAACTIENEEDNMDTSSLAFTSETATESEVFSSEEYASNEKDDESLWKQPARCLMNEENGTVEKDKKRGATSCKDASSSSSSYSPDCSKEVRDPRKAGETNVATKMKNSASNQEPSCRKQAPCSSCAGSSNGVDRTLGSSTALQRLDQEQQISKTVACDAKETVKQSTSNQEVYSVLEEESASSDKMQQVQQAASGCNGSNEAILKGISSTKTRGCGLEEEASLNGIQQKKQAPACNGSPAVKEELLITTGDPARQPGAVSMIGSVGSGIQRKQPPHYSKYSTLGMKKYWNEGSDAQPQVVTGVDASTRIAAAKITSSLKSMKRESLLNAGRAYKSTGSLFDNKIAHDGGTAQTKNRISVNGGAASLRKMKSWTNRKHWDTSCATSYENMEGGSSLVAATTTTSTFAHLNEQEESTFAHLNEQEETDDIEKQPATAAAAAGIMNETRSSTPTWSTYDDRIARKKRELMKKASARASLQGNMDQTASQSECPRRKDFRGNDGCGPDTTPGDDDFAPGMLGHQGRCQSERTTSRASGDELTAAAGSRSYSAPGDELAKQMMMSVARHVPDIDQQYHPDEKEDEWKKDSFASIDDVKMGVARSLSNDSIDEDEPRPGAYPVRGRAFGTFPEWGRHQRQDNRIASNDDGLVDPDDLMENGEVDSELMQVTATILDEDELANKVREEMIRTAVQGEVVDPPADQNKFKRTYIAACVVVAIAFIGVVVGLVVGLTNNSRDSFDTTPPGMDQSVTVSPTASPTPSPMPTLETIKERGKLNCGVFNLTGFYRNETGSEEGFLVDLCRAVAAAIFGDGSAKSVEMVLTNTTERFTTLQNTSIDLLASAPTYTMERDIYLKSTGSGFSFATPFLYDGLGFAGTPPYGACADNLSSYAGDCRLLRVCVTNESSHVPVVKRLLPEPVIVLCDDVIEAFMANSCNAMAGEKTMLAENRLRSLGYNGSYEIGTNIYSKEPLALATRDDDVQWSDFVNLVMHALFAAEAQGVTQSTASNLSTTNVFGKEFENMFINAVAAVGNYGEIYERSLEALIPREDVNMINTKGDTGLYLSNPFGEVDIDGPGPTEDSTLANITLRGNLRCGVTVREGFANFDLESKAWVGLDAECCYAIASSIFNRSITNVIFVNLTASETFLSLANGNIDVLAGASANVLTEVMESSSGQGFSFSQPYFYDPPSGVADNLVTRSLATRQDDTQWSSFVYWIVASFFHAEETYVMQSTFEKMPIVNLFGSAYAGMFQDAIFAVGNYEEMYERNLEQLIPRTGRNQLNKNPLGPQHFPLPGI